MTKNLRRHTDNEDVRYLQRTVDERGFAVSAILVTVALAGILAAIAFGVWQSVDEGRQVNAAAGQLASDLRLARDRAVEQSRNWQVEYEVPSGGYRLVPEGGQPEARSLPGETGIASTDVVGAGNREVVATGPGPKTITFGPDGQVNAEFADADIDGEIDITVRSGDGDPEQSVTVDPETAEVNVEPAR